MIVVSATGQQQNLTDPNQIATALSQGGTLLGANGQPLQGSVSGDPSQGADWTFNGQSLQQLIGSQPATGGTTTPTQTTTTGGTSPLSNAFNTPTTYTGGAPQPYQFGPSQSPAGPTAPGYLIPQGYLNSNNISNTLGGLINQGQLEAQFGQNALSNILGSDQSFAQGLGGYLENAMGLSSNAMANMPASINWAGQSATGAENTQNSLIQQLLGQSLGGLSTAQGQTTNPLMSIMNQFQGNNGPLGAGPGLATSAQNMLTSIGSQLAPYLTQSLGLMNQGLNPATSAALQTQAMDQTAQQYNNAKQATMTQLMNQGVMGGGAANPGGGEAQSLNDLGALSTAQQQQQSQLQQQAILANQNALEQNIGYGLQGVGLTANTANQFAGLEQQGAETGYGQELSAAQELNQLGLGGSQLTGGLAGSLGSLYGNQSLGYGNLLNNYYNTTNSYANPYLSTESGTFGQMLQGSDQLGQLGIQGVSAGAPYVETAAQLQAPGASSALWGSIFSSLGSIFGGALGNGGALNPNSDIRLKKNIKSLSFTIAGLTPVSWEWRQDEFPEYGFRPGRFFGFIAQQVENVFPDVVGTDRNGYKTVDYWKLRERISEVEANA